MIQVASREQALIKQIENQFKTTRAKQYFFSKTYTLEFECDRHLKHMVSYQGMQSGLPVFLVGEFGTLKIFMQNDCLEKPDFSYLSNYKHHIRS